MSLINNLSGFLSNSHIETHMYKHNSESTFFVRTNDFLKGRNLLGLRDTLKSLGSSLGFDHRISTKIHSVLKPFEAYYRSTI